jgi:hypothetical protein
LNIWLLLVVVVELEQIMLVVVEEGQAAIAYLSLEKLVVVVQALKVG